MVLGAAASALEAVQQLGAGREQVSGFRAGRARSSHARFAQLPREHAAHETGSRPQVDHSLPTEAFNAGRQLRRLRLAQWSAQ